MLALFNIGQLTYYDYDRMGITNHDCSTFKTFRNLCHTRVSEKNWAKIQQQLEKTKTAKKTSKDYSETQVTWNKVPPKIVKINSELEKIIKRERLVENYKYK